VKVDADAPLDMVTGGLSRPPDTRIPRQPGPPAPSGSSTGVRADIQALRAVAVLLVVAYHAAIPGLPGGYVGVDVFFVISGFVITTLLLKEAHRDNRISIAQFYARRARRILPASTVVLLSTVAAAHLLLSPSAASRASTDGWWSTLFAANIHLAAVGTDYLGSQLPPSPLQHFWSLAVEEQFYVLWPLLVLACVTLVRARRRLVLAGLLVGLGGLSLALSVTWTQSQRTVAYFSPATRAWELAAGAAVAVAVPLLVRLPRRTAQAISAAGGLAVTASVALFTAATPFPGTAALLPVLGCAAIIAGGTSAANHGGPALLGFRPLQHLGALSYSLYLWHWPLLTITAEHTGHTLAPATRFALVGAAVVLAHLSFQWVENPVRHSAALSLRPARGLALGASLVGAAVALTTGVAGLGLFAPSHTSPTVAVSGLNTIDGQAVVDVATGAQITRLPEHLTPTLDAAPADVSRAGADGCLLDFTTSVPAAPSACTYGEKAASRTVVLFGDSHAGMWLPAFDEAAKASGRRLVLIAKSACPAAAMTMWNPQLGRTYRECDQWRQRAEQQITQLHPDQVVLTGNGSGITRSDAGRASTTKLDTYWQRGLVATLAALRPAADRLEVLGDIPALSQDPPSCLFAHRSDVRACKEVRSQAVNIAHDTMEQRTAAEQRAGYLDVLPWLCTDTACPAVIGPGGTTGADVVYYNQFHITATYARHLSGVVGRALEWPGT